MRYARLISIALLMSMASCQQDAGDPRPNIILIMADDLGYGGLSSYGSTTIHTPNIDRLAAEGMKFTDFHANGAVCSPTRAALMTGRYQQRAGLEGVIYARGPTRETGLDTAEVTMAEVLRAAGYRTGIMGKWHLGYGPEYNPVYHGFDEFYGYRSGNIDYHTHYDNTGVYDWYHNLDTIHEEGYVTDLITSHSVDFIRENRESPFFLYIAHEAPHVPFQGRDDPGYRYPDKDFSYLGPVEDRHRAYREMVEVMDEGVGEVMETLREHGLLEKTLVFFISDNGGLKGFGDNGPLNGAKGNLYEGGHRVPGMAYWKDRIVPAVSDELVMSMDIFPTAMALAGVPEVKTPDLDGIDLSPLLFEGESPGNRTVFWRYREGLAMREGNFKLLITGGDTLLFDLTNDLGETNDLSAAMPDRLEAMGKILGAWALEMDRYPQKTE